MSAVKKVQRLSYDEYMAIERSSDVRHEYIEGEIYAMTGASRAHNTINVNVVTLLNNHLRDTPCRIASNDMNVRIEVADRGYYPDIIVSCSDPTDEPSEYIESRPKIIIEILSPSTEGIDRKEKKSHYQRLGSLQEYVLIAQDEPRVDIHRRLDDGSGWEHEQCGKTDTIALRSIDLAMNMTDIYNKVGAVIKQMSEG